jgi:hypothetical protein
MITDKLKQLIFNKLTDDLSHVELILYADSLWFIDREKKCWYLEFHKNGTLCWRWDFFYDYFQLFCMVRSEYEPLIKEWVVSVLNGGVTTTITNRRKRNQTVVSVLNCGVTTTISDYGLKDHLVESILNCGVTTTIGTRLKDKRKIDEVLNITVM